MNTQRKTDQFSFTPFCTKIWGYRLDDEQYNIKDYLRFIEHLKTTEPSEQKSNMCGWQSRDNLQNESVFHSLTTKMKNICAEIIFDNVAPDHHPNLEFIRKNIFIDAMWANCNTKYSSNAAHIHDKLLAGVFYLKVPKDSGRLIFCQPAVRADAHPIRPNNYGLDPIDLSLIIFPSWLEHFVEYSMSDEERISISFNVGVNTN